MQKSPRLWESLCPSTLASHTYFLPVLYLDSEQSSKAALKAFSQSGKKRKEKLRPTWECICFECLLPALSDVWPYTKQKGILDVDSLSDPSPWSKTYSQHLQPSWSYLRQLSTENRIPASIDTGNWGPNDFEIILQIPSLQKYVQGICFSKKNANYVHLNKIPGIKVFSHRTAMG